MLKLPHTSLTLEEMGDLAYLATDRWTGTEVLRWYLPSIFSFLQKLFSWYLALFFPHCFFPLSFFCLCIPLSACSERGMNVLYPFIPGIQADSAITDLCLDTGGKRLLDIEEETLHIKKDRKKFELHMFQHNTKANNVLVHLSVQKKKTGSRRLQLLSENLQVIFYNNISVY